MRFPVWNRGFTLLEVLIAVLVFSLGLLGVAGLMVLSVRTNHSAYLRTQASFLAESMADRMRSNMSMINSYNGTYDDTTRGSGTCGPCTPADLVKRDKEIWSQQLVDFLPNRTATITCQGARVGTDGAAPYKCLCTMIIKWTEADLKRDNSVATPPQQTFAWVFQP